MYKVIKSFTDKYTGEKYQVGNLLAITEERAKEILKVGNLIELVELETKDEEATEEAPKKKKRKAK